MLKRKIGKIALGFAAAFSASAALATVAQARDLTVVSWGGAYQDAQKKVYFEPFKKPFKDGLACRIVMLHPESRGELMLSSADPATPIRIRQNFMSTDREWRTQPPLAKESLGKQTMKCYTSSLKGFLLRYPNEMWCRNRISPWLRPAL